MNRFVFAVLVAFAALSASAQDATLSKFSGRVSVLGGGATRFVDAKAGGDLLFGDTIRVGKGGVAHVVFPDGGAVLLREDTMLTLKGSPNSTLLSFRFGEFLIGLKKKLGPGQSFKVRTPAAVAAVRGTLFWGKSGKKDKASTYAGFGHVVAVTAKGKTVLVEPGKTVTVAFGEAPSEAAPSTIGLDYAQKFAVDGSLQDVENLAETDKLK